MRFKSNELFHYVITTGKNDAQQISSIKKGCYKCQWLDNVDMHLYAKCDQELLAFSLLPHKAGQEGRGEILLENSFKR